MRFKIGVPWKLHFKNYYYLWIGDAWCYATIPNEQFTVVHIPFGLDENIFVSSNFFFSCIPIFIHQVFSNFESWKKVLWPVSFRSIEDFGPFFPYFLIRPFRSVKDFMNLLLLNIFMQEWVSVENFFMFVLKNSFYSFVLSFKRLWSVD